MLDNKSGRYVVQFWSSGLYGQSYDTLLEAACDCSTVGNCGLAARVIDKKTGREVYSNKVAVREQCGHVY